MTDKIAMHIDDSVIKDMIEGVEAGKSQELLKIFKRMEEDGVLKSKMHIATTQASFSRAIFLAEEIKTKQLQQFISCVQIYPSIADFRDKDAVIRELVTLAKVFGGREE